MGVPYNRPVAATDATTAERDGRRVLVVDDEAIVRDVLSRYLVREGFVVSTASDGEQALAELRASHPDLVLLDLMLPRVDGLEVFRRMQAAGPPAVIMLTARGEETDRLVGLEMGADDYVTKPFSPREVVARVRAVLRRTDAGHDGGVEPPPILTFDDLEIDAGSRELRRRGVPVRLTPKEFDVLLLLASHPRQVFSRIAIRRTRLAGLHILIRFLGAARRQLHHQIQ
jgi:DNA-binding response OmpR family regulator